MGSGLPGEVKPPEKHDATKNCSCGNVLEKIIGVKIFIYGRIWEVEGYLFCPKCKVIYREEQK